MATWLTLGLSAAMMLIACTTSGQLLAGQRKEGLKAKFAFQRLGQIEQFGVFLGRVATHVEQRQHQRREFMAQRDAGKMSFPRLPSARRMAKLGTRSMRCRHSGR